MNLCIKSCKLLSKLSENISSHDKIFKMGILNV